MLVSPASARGIGTELAADAGMPKAALAPLIHALFSHGVPFLLVAALAGLLLGGLARSIEREIARGFRSMAAAFKGGSAQSSSSLYCEFENRPDCPACDVPMVKRSVRRGPRAGKHFWGCSNYPMCRVTRPLRG